MAWTHVVGIGSEELDRLKHCASGVVGFAQAQCLLMAVAIAAGYDDDELDESIGQLSDRTQLGERTVRRALDAIAEAGLAVTLKRGGSRVRRGSTRVVTFGTAASEVAEDQSATAASQVAGDSTKHHTEPNTTAATQVDGDHDGTPASSNRTAASSNRTAASSNGTAASQVANSSVVVLGSSSSGSSSMQPCGCTEGWVETTGGMKRCDRCQRLRAVR